MKLEDSRIIKLIYQCSERAITELSAEYGALYHKIAENILNNSFDAEECVNDAYLRVWNTIPPKKPDPLLAYVCRIVRNISITRYHANTALKRNFVYAGSGKPHIVCPALLVRRFDCGYSPAHENE